MSERALVRNATLAIMLGFALAMACVSERSSTGVVSLGPCVGNVAKKIPASECPATCTESVVFALCDGKAYSSCSCSLPSGFMLAIADAGTLDVAEPDGNLSSLDASGLGACAGKVVLEIQASECPLLLCPTDVAFAVCEGASYTECSCTIPSGYKLYVADSGAVESGSDAALDAFDGSLDAAEGDP
jgi:hypothetical protein